MPQRADTLVKSFCCFGFGFDFDFDFEFFFDVVLYTPLRSLRYSPLLAEIHSLYWTDTHHDASI